jgi:DNA-binding HxlR family transcriptional regulator
MVGRNACHPDSRTVAGVASSFYELPRRDSTCDDRDVVAEVDRYCSFTKAVEHLGDRWNLLIVAELVASGPQGFNALAARLPGRIARSVLAERLRRLTDLGLVGRSAGRGPYRLTPAGEGLASTLWALRDWSTTWLPDDPAIVDRDPDVVLAWLTRRVAPGALPAQPVVIEIRMRHERLHRCWLVLEHGQPPYGCLHDPLLDESRYVYVDATSTVLVALARGRLTWSRALRDGSVAAFGDPALTGQLSPWLDPAEQPGELDVNGPQLARPAAP